MATQVLLYHKKTGEVVATYPASVKEWLASGEYQVEPPKNAKTIKLPQKLPTAGREANRLNPVIEQGPQLTAASEVDAQAPDAEPAAVEPQAEPEIEKPKRAEPRRRPRASAGD